MSFTPLQQASHCRTLAMFLRDQVADDLYDHSCYSESTICGTIACALGWAAHLGIGSLFLHDEEPRTNEMAGPFESAEHVFGTGSFEPIFHGARDAFLVLSASEVGATPKAVSVLRLLEQANALEGKVPARWPVGP